MKTKPLCTTVLVLSSIWFGTGAHVLLHGQLSAARESHIPVGGAELYVREVGKGPAIIVLHGGPDFDQSYLLPEMDRLSDSYRLIYYDQRGRGKSANNVRPEDVTLASDIADLEKVRQYFHLESVTLLGHSWGTVIALEYALKYPKRVSHLILMNPGPASREDYVQFRKEWLEKRADWLAQRKAIAETAAYKEGDPEAVTAYYRIHFKPAFARTENYEKLIAGCTRDFAKEGVLKARAVEDRLMQDTWAKSGLRLAATAQNAEDSDVSSVGRSRIHSGVHGRAHCAGDSERPLVTLKDCGHFTLYGMPSCRSRADQRILW